MVFRASVSLFGCSAAVTVVVVVGSIGAGGVRFVIVVVVNAVEVVGASVARIVGVVGVCGVAIRGVIVVVVGVVIDQSHVRFHIVDVLQLSCDFICYVSLSAVRRRYTPSLVL